MQDTKLDDASTLFSQALVALLKAPQDRLAFAGASNSTPRAAQEGWNAPVVAGDVR